MRKIIIAASSDHKIVKVPVGSVAIPRADLDAAIEALTDTVWTLQSASNVPLADPYILAELTNLCERVGYGNVMASASALWRHKLGTSAGGEFVSGPCRSTAQNNLRVIEAALTNLKGHRDAS